MTFILLDNTKDAGEGAWLFENPIDIIRADTPEQVLSAIEQLEEANKNALFTAGFCSFELAYVLEPSLATMMPQQRTMPLVWYGVFRSRQKLSRDEATAFLQSKKQGDMKVGELYPQWSLPEYTSQFNKAREAISAGEVYQLNLTFKSSFDCDGDPIALYLQLREQQPVSFGAYIDAPEFKILSLSPELFIRQNGVQIETRPMKGTAPRAYLPEEDVLAARALAADEKSRAENLMIVDLMRNDIGRIAEHHSVKVQNLFEVETYKTLHQIISTVQATLKPNIGLLELLKALFAPGSVVGAPKIQAIKWIRALEQGARGVYCGAIGMMGGDQKVFNVVIRTVVLIPTTENTYKGEMGIGSGLVYDSIADNEYQECLLKAKFFTQHAAPFGLIETLRFDKGRGYYLLERHLQRLAASAAYFAIPHDMLAIHDALNAHVASCELPHLRVRLELSPSGAINIQSTSLPADASNQTIKFVIAKDPIHSNTVHLYHKTTARAFLDDPCKAIKEKTDCDEVVYVNERGELTQGSYMNLFLLQNDGTYLTPPISAGLLPGTFRAEFMATYKVIEKPLFPADIDAAKAVFLGNSVRGLLPAKLISYKSEYQKK